MIKTDVKFGEVHDLRAQVAPAADKVQFKNIVENAYGGVALLAFEAGQALSTHLAPAELMVYVLEGRIRFTVLNTPHEVAAGQFLLVGEGVPHSVEALDSSKVMLVKIKP